MLNKKSNTARRFPGERGPRPDLAKLKRQEAKERQAEYDKLSLKEKLAKLPKDRCEKQRKKFTEKPETDLTAFKEIVINGKQKLKAKDRRAIEQKESGSNNEEDN